MQLRPVSGAGAAGVQDTGTLKAFQEDLLAQLRPVDWAAVVFTSATTRQRLPRILDAVAEAGAQHRRRVTTATLNLVVREAVGWRSPPSLRGDPRKGRIYYSTQVGSPHPSSPNSLHHPYLPAATAKGDSMPPPSISIHIICCSDEPTACTRLPGACALQDRAQLSRRAGWRAIAVVAARIKKHSAGHQDSRSWARTHTQAAWGQGAGARGRSLRAG